MFVLKLGYPVLNSFDNEMDVFRILMVFHTQLHSLSNRPESRVRKVHMSSFNYGVLTRWATKKKMHLQGICSTINPFKPCSTM